MNVRTLSGVSPLESQYMSVWYLQYDIFSLLSAATTFRCGDAGMFVFSLDIHWHPHCWWILILVPKNDEQGRTWCFQGPQLKIHMGLSLNGLVIYPIWVGHLSCGRCCKWLKWRHPMELICELVIVQQAMFDDNYFHVEPWAVLSRWCCVGGCSDLCPWQSWAMAPSRGLAAWWLMVVGEQRAIVYF